MECRAVCRAEWVEEWITKKKYQVLSIKYKDKSLLQKCEGFFVLGGVTSSGVEKWGGEE